MVNLLEVTKNENKQLLEKNKKLKKKLRATNGL